MNTRFKFRIWDTRFKHWAIPHSAPSVPRLWVGSDGSFVISSLAAVTDETAVIEQWTGLTDSTGREIYEGDVIEIAEEFGDDIPEDISLNDPRIVQFPTDARGGLIFRGKLVGQVRFSEGAFRCFARNLAGLPTRVVGNIHEKTTELPS